ncbi:MAG: trypsin-like peptidase domain-containing protein [Burkholderiales bacterium]|nr:trypsin-like peptidase domain-containing protein [Burkholderiales bacterium]
MPTRLCIAALALLIPHGASGAANVVAVPPADVRGNVPIARVALVAPTVTAARRVTLGAPSASEIEPMTRQNVRARIAGRGVPLAIGFARGLPAASRSVDLRGLAWTTAGDRRVARIEIASRGAAALRVALQLPDSAPDGMSLRFQGSGASDVFGATAAQVADETAKHGQFWSPALAGDVATIEISLPAAASLGALTLGMPRVSHAVIDGADLLNPSAPLARQSGIGASGACNVDVACVAASNPMAAELAKSVARMTFIDGGTQYLCTGTLLNDSVQSGAPYLLTADHCVPSQAIARTVNTYWFYAAATCNGKTAPAYARLTGGATLLGRSQDNDWSILRLLETPPAGTKFAAWRAEPIANGTSVVTLHHPAGDLVKYSRGTVTGNLLIEDDLVNGLFTEVVWSEGVTEAGSSGGALATLAPAGAYYEVRGGLYAGLSQCSAPRSPDYYSHFEYAYPLMREYLTPNAPAPNGVVAVVEFYNRGLDHYFLSTNPLEIANLDSGRTRGWERTGLRFLVYNHPAPGTSPVCRFYRPPPYGDSHFYSASPAECARTTAAHPVDWTQESPNVFYVALPDPTSGACPGGTLAVYRYFNAYTVNHRYTAERFIRNQMDASPLWTAEGYGSGPYYPVMCAAAA